MRDRSGQGPPSTSQKEDILQRMKEKQQSFYTEGRRKEFNWSVITLHVWSDTSWGDYPQSSVRAHYSSPRVISSCHLMSQKKIFFYHKFHSTVLKMILSSPEKESVLSGLYNFIAFKIWIQCLVPQGGHLET